MANEIIAMRSNPAGNSITVLMIFPLDPGKLKQVGGSNVVPTPSSELTSDELAVISATHQANLDSGESVFRRVSIDILDSDTGATLTNKVQQRYSNLAPVVQNAYDKIYRFIGSTLNAPS